MSIPKDHPNYPAYLKESHKLSQEINARIKTITDHFGDGEDGIQMIRSLQIEAAERRRALEGQFVLHGSAPPSEPTP